MDIALMEYVYVRLDMGAQIAPRLLVTRIAWLVNAMEQPPTIVRYAILPINFSSKSQIPWRIHVIALNIIISMELPKCVNLAHLIVKPVQMEPIVYRVNLLKYCWALRVLLPCHRQDIMWLKTLQASRGKLYFMPLRAISAVHPIALVL